MLTKDCDFKEAVKVVVQHIKEHFVKADSIAFSESIDGTRIPKLAQANYRHKKIFGGAAPDHCIDLPEDDHDGSKVVAILDLFKGDNPEKKLASEVKLGTLSLQWTPPGITPFLQVMARPQTKNQNSSFNFDFADVLKQAEVELREEGYDVSFISAANDGVSSDHQFVITIQFGFLDGRLSYCAHTDSNHIVKNARYQDIVGGNAASTIGRYFIDPGLPKRAELPVEIYIIKDFASDFLVLDLVSATHVAKILDLPNQDHATKIVTSLTLFFLRVHLFAINSKGKLSARERIIMLWCSLLFQLHIDGVSIITKRNWVLECISMSFLMMRSDVVRPHRLTSKPSEHSFAILHTMIREFTVSDFVSLIQKLRRFWMAKVRSNLKVV